MSAITLDYIMPRVKELLPFINGEEELYDNQLDILISGAIGKLRGEGIDIEAKDKEGDYIFQEDTYNSNDYIVCLTYQIIKDMDFDSDYDFLTEQYITRVNTLRCYVSQKQR